MTVALDGTMVFKKQNYSPLSYPDVMVKFKGVGLSADYGDAKIRKLWMRSFNF